MVNVTSAIITTIAGSGGTGSGSFSGDNGLATSATLNGPTGVAVDTSGKTSICIHRFKFPTDLLYMYESI